MARHSQRKEGELWQDACLPPTHCRHAAPGGWGVGVSIRDPPELAGSDKEELTPTSPPNTLYTH